MSNDKKLIGNYFDYQFIFFKQTCLRWSFLIIFILFLYIVSMDNATRYLRYLLVQTDFPPKQEVPTQPIVVVFSAAKDVDHRHSQTARKPSSKGQIKM